MGNTTDRQEIERHPWEPFLPPNSKVLLLGTFPPRPDKWSMNFYYPNINNDMWRVIGELFFKDSNHFIDTKQKAFDEKRVIEFLKKEGIALGGTALDIIRTKGNASDAHLKIVKHTDIEAMLAKIPKCRVVASSGKLAADLFAKASKTETPKMGHFIEVQYGGRSYKHFRMPSTSRAYPLPLKEKTEAYREMFKEAGLL